VHDLVCDAAMTQVSIHEAKAHLSQLLHRVACGEEIVIAKGAVPVAKLVPFSAVRTRHIGRDRGLYSVPEDFDAPLPEDVPGSFER
jgi:prevent-host-death family protein